MIETVDENRKGRSSQFFPTEEWHAIVEPVRLEWGALD